MENDFNKIEGKPTDLINMALKDASNIEQFVKDQAFPSGTLISKNSLRIKFNLAQTRSQLVFQILKQHGYGIEIRNIRVP